jgi:hypothetical protein
MCPLLKAILHVTVDAHNGGERTKALHMVKRLPAHSLLLFDAGFSGAPLFNTCLRSSVHFVGRIAINWLPTKIRELGQNDWLVKLDKVSTPLRLIEFSVNKVPYRILTDLTDPIVYPTKDVIRLYLYRWEQEIALGYLKRLAGPAFGAPPLPLRAQSPELVLQEVYALMVVYNEVSLKTGEIADAAGISPLRISFTTTLHMVRLEALGATVDKRFANLPVMRPRRKRSYPREIKPTRARFNQRGPDYRGTRWDRPGDSQAALNAWH